MQEDEATDKQLQIIDDQARMAHQKAQEIERQALREREDLTTKLSRQRRLCQAQQEFMEAEAISTMIDDSSSPLNGKLTIHAPPIVSTPAPTKVTGDISQEPDIPVDCPLHLPPSLVPVHSPSAHPASTFMDLLVAALHGIPKPTLPKFWDGKEKDFALLKMALKNLLNVHPHLTEHCKFQVMIDRLGGQSLKLAVVSTYM